MKRLIFALILVGCASTVPYEGVITTVSVSSNHKDPVDVRFYCNGARVKVVRWLMLGRTEKVNIRTRGCDFRVIIEPSIQGGDFTRTEGYDSERHLLHIGSHGCRKLDVVAGPMLPASYTMPSACRR